MSLCFDLVAKATPKPKCHRGGGDRIERRSLVKHNKMSKKSSTVDPPTKKISLASLSGSDTPPRKKSSLKENFQNLMRAPNFLIKREAAKKVYTRLLIMKR
ncbi:hypothetical protein ANCCEY_10851 [Ancylostoma ceylanicum]|uniref:Uncharacterized protein n=1 Tax=Ancylostoma ceylanicum TaxID=53326 RepID=A0A0D6LDQ2_9BILA|nr:hypothetical protein ANCCEY_10851 [Ancylostoma ceylanicum]